MLSAPLLFLLALQASAPAEELERGKAAFGRAEYARTIEILGPLLYPEPRLESEGEIAIAHRMLGVAHLFERQNDQAAAEFRKLLQLRPDYRMDTLLDPPLVVDFFNGILKQQEAELAALARKKKEAEAEERRRLELARNGPLLVERRVLMNSFAINFLPFGAGQFQNGQRGKAWFFLGTESALAGVSVAAMTTNFALYGLRPKLRCVAVTNESQSEKPCGPGFAPTDDQKRSRLLLKVQIVSGALFFATAGWGVVDAILNFNPEIRLPAAPVRVPKATTDLRLGVLYFGEGNLGGGLTFRF